jgi:hypothetical protein
MSGSAHCRAGYPISPGTEMPVSRFATPNFATGIFRTGFSDLPDDTGRTRTGIFNAHVPRRLMNRHRSRCAHDVGINLFTEGYSESVALNPGDRTLDPADVADIDPQQGTALNRNRPFAHHSAGRQIAHLDSMEIFGTVETQICEDEHAVAGQMSLFGLGHGVSIAHLSAKTAGLCRFLLTGNMPCRCVNPINSFGKKSVNVQISMFRSGTSGPEMAGLKLLPLA